MLATQRMSPPNSVFAGNQAGAPLPLIPRRLSRESSSSVPVKVVIQQSSPPLPLDDSGSSSSSDSGRPTVSIRAKRVCSEKPIQTDPTPRRPPLVYSPGVSLRPTTTRNFSESHARSSSASSSSGSASLEPPSPSSILSASQSQPRLIRKKSGQLVKSSLKTSKSLSLLTPCSPYSNSKSAPATPTHTPKNVHFDAQLEHVKLFLAEQKPLAVSRDGSPTEDTASGTDTDFPDWVFGSNSSSSTRNLTMHHINIPPRLSANNNEVLLESLELSSDSPSVVGRVRVANLAYTKSVVARFTFDAWQTTSEVSARYISSPSPRTDIFVFSVRLNDLMARIDGKRMCLAVRYSIGGREMWDNNGGSDYLVEFGLVSKSKDSERELALEREREREREREDRSRRPTPDPNAIASLRSTLEKVVAPSPVPRYDFSQSLSSRWVPPSLPHTPVPRTSSSSAQSHAHTHAHGNSHVRTQSYPSPGSTPRPIPKQNSNSIPWPRGAKERERERWTPPLGSPRDASDEDRSPFASYGHGSERDADTKDLSFPVNTRTHIHTPTPGRHHRRGYFDLHHSNGSESGKGSGVRRTPPGSPPAGTASESDEEESGEDEGEGEGEKTPMPGRCYSFPPTSTRVGTGNGTGTAGLGFFGGSDARGGHGHTGIGRSGAGMALGEGVGIGMRMTMGMGMGVGMRMGEDSELSTPSFGSSRATSPSPSPSPTESEVSTETDDTETETECEGDGGYKRFDANDGASGSYKEFLSRFCFFTGTGTATGVGLFPDSSHSPPHALPPHSSHIRAHTYPNAQKRFIVPRTHSASEIIESPRPLLPLQERAMAVRSPSFDDVLLGSGAATPVGGMSPPTLV